MMHSQPYDLLIIGGGINGAGIAADAAGRGLKVILCEKSDLAGATSSASSKMIHGGLRYLENFEFKLVKESLHEREILLKVAPHLIHPLRLLVPHDRSLRPYWVIRLGLYLYDQLDRHHRLSKSKTVQFRSDKENPLLPIYKKGFSYSDAWVDDARLVITNIISAHNHGATILTHHEVISAKRRATSWEVTITNHQTGKNNTYFAKALINAAGPWVGTVLQQLNLPARHSIRLVKGSHIVLPKIHDLPNGYLLQNIDKRVIFVLPYQGQFTLVGTTDVDYQGDPKHAKISQEEQQYLCDAVNRYFAKSINPSQIIWSYAGVRPLQYDENADPSKVTRDYTFEIHDEFNQLPILSIFGGKITTYRKLAEHALEKLVTYFPNLRPAWTDHTPLPGGDIEDFDAFVISLSSLYPWLPKNMLNRLAQAYGTRCQLVLDEMQCMKDLGIHFGGTLYECEVRYLIAHEWANTVEDILWRRTKQGLLFNEGQIKQLNEWLQNYLSN